MPSCTPLLRSITDITKENYSIVCEFKLDVSPLVFLHNHHDVSLSLMRLQKNKCYNNAGAPTHTHTHTLSQDQQIAINVQTWKTLHKEDQYAYFTLAASLTWGMSSSSFRISLNWNKRTLCTSVSIWTDVCQDLVSDSCHFTHGTQQALRHVHLLTLAVEIKQCLMCVLLNYTTLSNM